MENITPPVMTDTPPTLTDPATITSETENAPTPLGSHRPLSLWELMRKDDDPASPPPADETDRVLSSLRPSIWDID